MAVKKPLILNAGKLEEIKSPDTIDPSFLPSAGGALYDGGSATTSSVGLFRIDFGTST